MSKYNEKRVSIPDQKPTVTLQGGPGFTQKAEKELIGILSTGLSNTFYEKETEREKRFKEVLNEVAKKNPLFAAKALIYARTVFGQRSVTHYGAVELIAHLSGTELAKRFFSKRDRKVNRGGIIYRLDDMAEILACYQAKNGAKAPMPNSLKKGFKDAIENSDAYTLAKYQMKSRGISLVDIVNLVHPHATTTNGTVKVSLDEFKKAIKGTKFEKEYDFSFLTPEETVMEIPAIRALVLGILKQFNTAEDKNTKSGQEVAVAVKSGELSVEQAKIVLNDAKVDNYIELIKTKKIGYLALVRKLRNILQTNNMEVLDLACDLLVNEKLIKQSLIWPHQIDLALEIMTLEFSGQAMAKVTKALGIAYELSIPNLENLLPEGRTAVVFDTSGSMGFYSHVQSDKDGKACQINSTPAEKAALVAATFAKGVNGDVYHFADRAEKITGWNPNDSVNTLKQKFKGYSGRQGHGTDFGSCFDLFVQTNQQYDRVLIISDEQDGYGNVENKWKTYCNKFGTPYVYIINVCGYGPTAMKDGGKVFRLFGYTQAIYETIPQFEMNPQIVIDEINKIEI